MKLKHLGLDAGCECCDSYSRTLVHDDHSDRPISHWISPLFCSLSVQYCSCGFIYQDSLSRMLLKAHKNTIPWHSFTCFFLRIVFFLSLFISSFSGRIFNSIRKQSTILVHVKDVFLDLAHFSLILFASFVSRRFKRLKNGRSASLFTPSSFLYLFFLHFHHSCHHPLMSVCLFVYVLLFAAYWKSKYLSTLRGSLSIETGSSFSQCIALALFRFHCHQLEKC